MVAGQVCVAESPGGTGPMLLGYVGEAPCCGRPQAILAREMRLCPGQRSSLDGFALLDATDGRPATRCTCDNAPFSKEVVAGMGGRGDPKPYRTRPRAL
jgi:hypothetical protein